MIKDASVEGFIAYYAHCECRKCGYRVTTTQYALLSFVPVCDCGEPYSNFAWVPKPAHEWAVRGGRLVSLVMNPTTTPRQSPSPG